MHDELVLCPTTYLAFHATTLPCTTAPLSAVSLSPVFPTVVPAAAVPPSSDVASTPDIWADTPVLEFLKHHRHTPDSTPTKRDRVYRRVLGYRWLGGNVHNVYPGGLMLLIPLLFARLELVLRVHREIGHFGVNRVQGLLHKNYWWKGMESDVRGVIGSCNSCA